MPIFEYQCGKCSHRFETIILGSEAAVCPRCQSKKLEQQVSRFGVAKERPAAATAACGSCGDPRGPGACSMN
jgi:putative FmdB family regulatory protein